MSLYIYLCIFCQNAKIHKRHTLLLITCYQGKAYFHWKCAKTNWVKIIPGYFLCVQYSLSHCSKVGKLETSKQSPFWNFWSSFFRIEENFAKTERVRNKHHDLAYNLTCWHFVVFCLNILCFKTNIKSSFPKNAEIFLTFIFSVLQ